MKNVFLLSIAILAHTVLVAQRNNDNNRNRQQNRRSPSLSVGLQVADPVGQFGSVYDGTPTGLGAQFVLNSGRSPIEFGMGAAWQGMGSRKKDISIYQGEDIDGDEVWSHGEMQVSSNIYLYNGILRLRPFAGNFQIYGDLIGGVKSFSTRTVIEEDNGGYTEVIDQHRDQRDFGLSYGWAAGVKIRITEFMLVEGRFENLRGGQATYVDPDTISIDNEGQLDFETITSNTSSMIYQIGVSFEF